MASDRTAIFCVAHRWWKERKPTVLDAGLNVWRYNDSLNEFIPHFSWAWTDIEIPGTILFDNKLFRIGGAGITGTSFTGAALDSVVSYDLKTKSKIELRPMNERRKNHTLISMGKSIYVFGGCDGPKYLNSCERYDTETGTWQIIKPMKYPRILASAAILNGLIYVVGTCAPIGSTYYVESYDPITDEWTERMAMKEGKFTFPLVAFNGMLYAFLGGQGVREYDSVKNTWTKMKVYHDLESVISANGSLFAITAGGSFGHLTIAINERERKMDFAMRGKMNTEKWDDVSLQQCQYEQ